MYKRQVKTRVREALSSYIYRRTKRSPMILPILMAVSYTHLSATAT